MLVEEGVGQFVLNNVNYKKYRKLVITTKKFNFTRQLKNYQLSIQFTRPTFTLKLKLMALVKNVILTKIPPSQKSKEY